MQTTIEIHTGAPKHPVLNAFMACRERVSAIMGPLGSGKTFGALQRLLAHMTEQAPNERIISMSHDRTTSRRRRALHIPMRAVKDWASTGCSRGLGQLRSPF